MRRPRTKPRKTRHTKVKPKIEDALRPGKMPEIKTPNPKQHPFVPYEPGSTKCKWCMFSISAHSQIAADVELHPKDKDKQDGR